MLEGTANPDRNTFARANEFEEAKYLTCITCNYYSILRYLNIPRLNDIFLGRFYFQMGQGENALKDSVFEHVAVEHRLWQHGVNLLVQECENFKQFQQQLDYSLREGIPALAYGNGFYMPWTPFFQKEHIEHTFVITGVTLDTGIWQVADSYVNNTKYGRAEPVFTMLSPLDCRVMLVDVPGHNDFKLVNFSIAKNPLSYSEPRDSIIASCAAYKRAIDSGEGLFSLANTVEKMIPTPSNIELFTLLCWLGVRAREGLAFWMSDSQVEILAKFCSQIHSQVLPMWRKLTEVSYVLSLRAGKRDIDLTPLVTALKKLEAMEHEAIELLTK